VEEEEGKEQDEVERVMRKNRGRRQMREGR
jgi:hypothetical protein